MLLECLVQWLSFHITIVEREFSHIAYVLLFSSRSDYEKYRRMQYHVFRFTLKKYFMLEYPFFKNSKENTYFIDIKQYFGKIKSLVISRRGNLGTKISTQQISKKLPLTIKSKMYNFMYVNEMKIKIVYFTNICL